MTQVPRFGGRLLGTGHADYERARRLWNGMHDRRPMLIAQCRSASDVAAVLRFAAAEDLPVTVRGGGHNVAGTAVADGAVLIDLSPMRAVTVDPLAGLVRAQGGALLRDVDVATAEHGLAVPAGVVSHTGLGGLALGGGYGWLARKWGLTCDHLVAAEVVLADGTIVHATEDEHADLLWALRGGGGNFGVVTEFTLTARPVGPIFYRRAAYPLSDAVSAIEGYQAFAVTQSDDLHAVGSLQHATVADWLPGSLAGEPALLLSVIWLGDPADGAARTDALFDVLAPAAQLTRVLSHLDLQSLGDTSEPHGHRYYTKSSYLHELAGPAHELARSAKESPSPLSAIDFEFLGGAIGRHGEESAFPNREASYMCTASAHWTDPEHDHGNIDWARTTIDRLRPWQDDGVYVNYLHVETPDQAIGVYGSARYQRLATVKASYDPQNVFHSNHNIRPAS